MNLKCCSGQKFNVIVIKTAHRRSDFLKTLFSQEIFVGIGFRKKSVLKLPEFSIWKMLIAFLQKFLSMLNRMRMDEAFYNIFMYLYNKNV